jgi:Redoxin/Putative zinc-finger
MRLPFTHPALSDLSDFAAGDLPTDRHQALAAHLQNCPRCQSSLRFVHRINEPADAPLPTVDAPTDQLLSRILSARRAGERVILPASTPVASRASSRAIWGIAAALVGVVALARLLAPREAMASGDEGVLTLAPASPQPGVQVQVRYVPAANLFVGAPTLRLRARLRRPVDESYDVPPSQLRVLTVLARRQDGSYEGTFSVPDSTVFAVMAVEDLDSAQVDDNSGRGWEMLVASANGSPLFTALVQRAEDMMGRSWEEGYASIVRATELYPDSISGWTHREFFERSLFSGAAGDSIRAVRNVTMDALLGRARQAPAMGYGALGAVYFRQYAKANRPGATAADSAEWRYWWQRLQREYPTHEQAAQRQAVWLDINAIGPAAALDSLERLYQHFAPLRGAGNNLLNVALSAANQLGDPARLRLWTERASYGARDSVKRVATFLASRPEYREEGMRALRLLLQDSTLRGMVTRPLGRSASMQWRFVRDARQSLFAALGKALVAGGQTRAALDTLRLAAGGGWDPALYRDLARTYAQAGDSAGAIAMSARLVVDGRTSPAQRDSLSRSGERSLGTAAWTRRVADARGDMYTRLLERSIARSVSPAARVTSRDGQRLSLADITKGRPALVIFWSRHCGAALDALPEIGTLVKRLASEGTPVAFVIDEAPSADLDRALSTLGVSWPVYYDARASLADAMRNFGTPYYYVVDRQARIRFTSVEQIGDIYARLEAVTAQDVGMP